MHGHLAEDRAHHRGERVCKPRQRRDDGVDNGEHLLRYRDDRVADGYFQIVEVKGKLHQLAGKSPGHLCRVARLVPAFFQDAVYLGLDLLLLCQIVGRRADGRGVFLPHFRNVFRNARVVHKDAVFVFQALRGALHGLAHGIACLTSKRRAVLQRRHHLLDLAVVIPAQRKVFVCVDGVRGRHKAVRRVCLNEFLRPAEAAALAVHYALQAGHRVGKLAGGVHALFSELNDAPNGKRARDGGAQLCDDAFQAAQPALNPAQALFKPAVVQRGAYGYFPIGQIAPPPENGYKKTPARMGRG